MPNQQQNRINWLLANPKTWAGIDFNRREICHNRSRHCCTTRILFEMMQASGLYSPKTNWSDAAIENLVAKATKIRNQKQMSCFQTVTVEAKNFSDVKTQALKQLVPDHSLGEVILDRGIREIGNLESEQAAEELISNRHVKGNPAYAVQIGTTNKWVVGGRFKD